jgi:hypothetical protein
MYADGHVALLPCAHILILNLYLQFLRGIVLPPITIIHFCTLLTPVITSKPI